MKEPMKEISRLVKRALHEAADDERERAFGLVWERIESATDHYGHDPSHPILETLHDLALEIDQVRWIQACEAREGTKERAAAKTRPEKIKR